MHIYILFIKIHGETRKKIEKNLRQTWQMKCIRIIANFIYIYISV